MQVYFFSITNQYNDIIDKHLKDVTGLEEDIKEAIGNSATTVGAYYDSFGDSVFETYSTDNKRNPMYGQLDIVNDPTAWPNRDISNYFNIKDITTKQ